MSHRLTVTLLAAALLAAALLAACQSNPTAQHSPKAEADAAAAAVDSHARQTTDTARRDQATLDRIAVTGSRLRSEQAKAMGVVGPAYAPPAPPPPAAPRC